MLSFWKNILVLAYTILIISASEEVEQQIFLRSNRLLYRTGCDVVSNNPAGDEGYTCGARIQWLQSNENMSYYEASDQVGNEFPDVCGPCRRSTPVSTPSTPSPVLAPSETCEDVWNHAAGVEEYTCGARIDWQKRVENMSDAEAKNFVADEFPDVCGSCRVTSGGGGGDESGGGGSGGVPSQRNKCGIVAVDPNVDNILSSTQCEQYGWSQTGDNSMACYINGRRGEPCVLDYGNDRNPRWMDKNPADCKGDTLYLWDEPYTDREIMNPPQHDGHGAWKQAGKDWAEYSQRWSNELTQARANGLKVTSPMGKYAELMDNIDAFFEGCEIGRGGCSDEGSPGYIDVIGINVYCGSWNTGCSDAVAGGYCCDIAASWSCNDIKDKEFGRPVYITNWSALGAEALPDVQLRAIKSTPKLFECGSHVVDRVYWYGAIMYDETPRESNFLYQKAGSGTLGSEWKDICDEINNAS